MPMESEDNWGGSLSTTWVLETELTSLGFVSNASLPIKPPHLPFLIFQTGLTLQCRPALMAFFLP